MVDGELRLDVSVVEALAARRDDSGRPEVAAFLGGLLSELPWWDRSWRVADVGAVRSSSSSRGLWPGEVQVVEVTVPGSLRRDEGEELPFSARVRLLGDRLLRWQMKVRDRVIGPALGAVGEPEPHPFGAVFRMLMELRGLSLEQVAQRTGRAMSTIKMLHAGRLVPERALIEQLARALELPVTRLATIAELDPADPGRG
ncbi:helix-turn-helix domain-containing protein [Actinoplanes sp. CA-054009]